MDSHDYGGCKSEICKTGWESGDWGRTDVEFKPEGFLKEEFLLFREPLVFSLNSFNVLDEAHLHYRQ